MDNTGNYGGSIREASGSLGSYAKSREEAYFREQDQKKLEELSNNKVWSSQTNKSDSSKQENKNS